MPIPETLSFFAFFVAQNVIFGSAFLILVVLAYFLKQFHLIEFRLASMIIYGNILMAGFAVWHYDTSISKIALWAIGSLLCASAIWAIVFLGLNVFFDRIRGGR